jgi:hypothetical protein
MPRIESINSSDSLGISIEHRTPIDQPTSLSELAGAIYGCYDFPQGQIKISGCVLDRIPIFAVDGRESEWQYVDSTGSRLTSELAQSLGVARTIPCNLAQIGVRPVVWQALLSQVQDVLRQRNSVNAGESELRQAIWCVWVTGKLTFTFNSESQDLTFAHWGRRLIGGPDRPPPFVCPSTGMQDYSIVTTDDGKLTVPAALGRCEVSGARVVMNSLLVSAVSGKTALQKFMQKCSVSGDWILTTEFVLCPTCLQSISPSSRRPEGCAGCHELPPLHGGLLRDHLVAMYPKLACVSRIFARQGESTTIVKVRQFWNEWLMVFEPDLQQLKRAAKRNLLTKLRHGPWHDCRSNLPRFLFVDDDKKPTPK